MRAGEVKAVLVSCALIVLTATCIFLFWITQSAASGALMFSVVTSLIFVGLPALFGIVAIQMPVARLLETRGLAVQGLAVAAANIAFTLATYSIASGQNVLGEPRAPYVLVGVAAAAALLWLVLDRQFRGLRHA